jgi:hypothetical protein
MLLPSLFRPCRCLRRSESGVLGVVGSGAGSDPPLRHGGMGRLFTGIRAPSTLSTSCGSSRSIICGNSIGSPPRCW